MSRQEQLKKLYVDKIVGGLLKEYVQAQKTAGKPLDKLEFRAFVEDKSAEGEFSVAQIDAIFEVRSGRQIDLPVAIANCGDELVLKSGEDPEKLKWVAEFTHGGCEVVENAVKVPKDGYYQIKASASFYQVPIESSSWISPLLCLSIGGLVKEEDRAGGNWLTSGVEKDAHEGKFALSSFEFLEAGQEVALYVANDAEQGSSVMKLVGDAKLSVYNVKATDISY